MATLDPVYPSDSAAQDASGEAWGTWSNPSNALSDTTSTAATLTGYSSGTTNLSVSHSETVSSASTPSLGAKGFVTASGLAPPTYAQLTSGTFAVEVTFEDDMGESSNKLSLTFAAADFASLPAGVDITLFTVDIEAADDNTTASVFRVRVDIEYTPTSRAAKCGSRFPTTQSPIV